MSISHAMHKYYEGEVMINKYRECDEGKEINRANIILEIAHAKTQAMFLGLEIACHKTFAQSKEQTRKMLKGTGFISSTSVPRITDVAEVFICSERGDCNITREDCLDYSGDSRHIDACQKCNCEHFTTTRKQVCP